MHCVSCGCGSWMDAIISASFLYALGAGARSGGRKKKHNREARNRERNDPNSKSNRRYFNDENFELPVNVGGRLKKKRKEKERAKS